MSTVRILRLYPDLLDLYGDGGNLMAITHRLEEMGHTAIVDAMELSSPKDLAAYDLIAVGAGKSRNLFAAMEDFLPMRDQLSRAVENGTTVLATGSGMILLGRSFRLGDQTAEGAGIFDYSAEETGEVSISDCIVTCDGVEGKLYGFSNMTASVSYGEVPNLFAMEKGSIGRDGMEGMQKGRCYATTLLGPILAKNPFFLRKILQDLLGDGYREPSDALAVEAWHRTISEFE